MGNPESSKSTRDDDGDPAECSAASETDEPTERSLGRMGALLATIVPERAKPALRRAWPYIGLFLLNFFFVFPATAHLIERRLYLVAQPAGDLLVLVLVCVITVNTRHSAWIRRASVVVGFVLWLFWWDAYIGRTVVHQTPLFYDQLFLLRHVMVLVSDLWEWWMAFVLIGVVLALIASVYIGRKLLFSVVDGLAARPRKEMLLVLAIMYGAMAGLMAATRPTVKNRKHRVMLWAAPKMGKNLRKSYLMYRDLEAGKQESPYADYETAYPLQRKPSVHMFFVESYGSVLTEHPSTRARWLRKTRLMQHALEDAGWHAVTGYSSAPVSGGRSWLAEGTVLTGIVMQYEALYQHVIQDIHQTPNLVHYLDAQGYETFLLAPKARARRGVRLVNHYDYDQTIFALDLDYRGPKVGWGVVPDQYSLGFAHENYYSKVDGPIFTNFHMVSSHAPWNTVPKVQDDWRDLNDPDGPDPFGALPPEAGGQEVKLRMARFKRRDPRYLYMGKADGLKLKAYARAIAYDLEIIEKHLLEIDGDQLVVIMGDHQPPMLWEVTEHNFDVPVHILSRDPDMLEVFRDNGFHDGLQIARGEPPAIGHEALYSLLVRTLARCCGEDGVGLPEVVHEGVRITDR